MDQDPSLSPSELVREQAYSLLADPLAGLNPALVAACQRRRIDVPITGVSSDPTQPFLFVPNSPNVFKMRIDIDRLLGPDSSQQYPCIQIYAKSAKQLRGQRVMGMRFFGEVTVEILAYLAWYNQQTPSDSDFEAHMDALEEAFFFALNSDVTKWYPAVYENTLDVQDRSPIVSINSDQLLRRCLRLDLTAIVAA